MQRQTWWWIGGLASGWIILIGLVQWLKYQVFGYNGLDLGIYAQVLWNLSHGYGLASSIHDPSYLGDHLELWLLPVAGLYRLWSHPLTALWIQTVVLALSVIPLARMTEKLLGEKFVPLVAGLFFLHPLLYNAAVYEFHGLVFALPILFWMIDAYLRRQYAVWLIAALGLLLVREDMPLLLAGWAVLAAVERRSWRWWAVPAVLAIGYFVAAQAIIRAANPLDVYKYVAFYDWLGHTPREMLTYPFRHPLIFLGRVFSVYNWQTAIGFLLTFGLLPLLRPRRLWPVVFVFLQLTLLVAATGNVLRLHYVIPYLPFLVWASLEGWREVHQNTDVALFGFKVGRRLDRSLLILGVNIFAITAIVYGQFLYGAAEWPWTADRFASRTPAPVLQSAASTIQPEDRVLTTFNLLPALSNRRHLYSLNYVHLGRRQYTQSPYRVPGPIDVAVIDWQQYYDFQFFYRDTLFEQQTGAQRLAALLKENRLRLAEWVDGVAVYRRAGKLVDAIVTPTPIPKPQSLNPSSLTLTQPPTLHTLGPLPRVPAYQQIQVTATWQLNAPPVQPWTIHFQLQKNGVVRWSHYRLLGDGINPSSEWTADKTWTTTYRLAVPDTLRGNFVLSAQVVALDGRMRLNRVRSFVPRVPHGTSILSTSLGSIQL